MRGRVLAKAASHVTVNHEDIPGFMPAMTMLYQVKSATDLEQVQPGDYITADLVVDEKKNYWLEKLVTTRRPGEPIMAATAPHEPEPGDEIPDVRLINQDGKTIHLSEFKGKAVLITFIYTRCPFPTYCPLLSNEFASIQRELLKTPDDYKKTHLVSVSLDPDFDTPPVMRKYGLPYVQDDPARFEHWDFVATTPADLKQLASSFGLTYFAENKQITHTMRTILLGPDGTVAQVWSGNSWKKPEILSAMRQAVGSASKP